ncbi:MAG: DUF1989 domain-containing protein [Limnochordia bacterium]
MSQRPRVRHRIPAQTGYGFLLDRGQYLRVVTPTGAQVADLVAFGQHDLTHWLSNGRTFDYSGTIYLTQGHTLYSNRSEPMLTIVADDVGRHDFLYTACSQEMFCIQYGIRTPHPNCLDNLAQALAMYGVRSHMIPTPFNIFMHVDVLPTGQLQIHPPKAKPGDSIIFRAETDLVVAVSACSASVCNGGSCKPIDIEIIGPDSWVLGTK